MGSQGIPWVLSTWQALTLLSVHTYYIQRTCVIWLLFAALETLSSSMQDATVFEDRDFKVEIVLEKGHYGNPNPKNMWRCTERVASHGGL